MPTMAPKAPTPGVPPKPPGAGGIGLPQSPIGGPAGPGASPMMSPGTGAGMQARAMEGIGKVIETLMAYAGSFPSGTPQFTGIMRAITALNGLHKAGPSTEEAKPPIPVPPTPPGAGLGGVGGPPTGLSVGGPGGAGPAEPGAGGM